MITHKTKGIVLRTINYGETSVITTMYTALFGVQSYIVKGARKQSKKSAGKAGFFQPGGILGLVVYHNELKNLQFIKEFEWGYIFQEVFFNVIKNAAATYMIELLQHSLKQPEASPELFYMIEDTLKQLDKGSNTLAANLPLYFALHLAGELGFQVQGKYSKATQVLDLREGCFVELIPSHSDYVTGETASLISQVNSINFYNDLDHFRLNRNTRREMLEIFDRYLSLHIEGFGPLKSLQVLKEILE